MGLDYCTECRATEQDWRKPTPEERMLHDLPEHDPEELDRVCVECGGVNTHTTIREYDDYGD